MMKLWCLFLLCMTFNLAFTIVQNDNVSNSDGDNADHHLVAFRCSRKECDQIGLHLAKLIIYNQTELNKMEKDPYVILTVREEVCLDFLPSVQLNNSIPQQTTKMEVQTTTATATTTTTTSQPEDDVCSWDASKVILRNIRSKWAKLFTSGFKFYMSKTNGQYAEIGRDSSGNWNGVDAFWEPDLPPTIKFWDQGATVVDSLQTFFSMELARNELDPALNWVKNSLNFNNLGDRYFHVKKTIPLYIGGLLGAYSNYLEAVFMNKAVELADILLPAFNMETGSVCVWFRPNQKECIKEDTSPFSSLFIEFDYLTAVTGNVKYRNVVDRALTRSLALVNNTDFKFKSWFKHSVQTNDFRRGITTENLNLKLDQSGGALLDYLQKRLWMNANPNRPSNVPAPAVSWQKNLRDTYFKLLDRAIEDITSTSKGGSFYTSPIVDGKKWDRMATSDCYVAGHMAIAGALWTVEKQEELGYQSQKPSKYKDLGVKLIDTCHLAYQRANAKLSPSAISFADNLDGGQEAEWSSDVSLPHHEYPPGTAEGYLLMYRITNNCTYRRWALEILDRLTVRFDRVFTDPSKPDLPIASLPQITATDITYDHNNNNAKPSSTTTDKYMIRQPSFVLGETLKMLHLMFRSYVGLGPDDFIMNSNAKFYPTNGSRLYKKIYPFKA